MRLRRPGMGQRTEVASGYSSSDSRGSDGAPVAPPRIKRNSSAGLPRHSTVDSSPSCFHNDWRKLNCIYSHSSSLYMQLKVTEEFIELKNN